MKSRRGVGVLLLTVLVALIVVTMPAVAPARTHVVVGIGPIWWDPFWPYPYYPYGPPYWYPPPYYRYPPPVAIEEPPVYVQREPALPSGYWYYCPSPNAAGYYPSVPTCSEPWIPVPPRP
jgi:hypothetical protein